MEDENKLLYELPTDNRKVAVIVDAIPSDWCWIDGFLGAPRLLYEQRRVAHNTGLLISRFYSIKPTIIGVDDVPFEDIYTLRERNQGLIVPQINDIVLRGKLHSSVRFDEAGFQTPQLPLSAVKELAREFILLGYKGWMSAYSAYKNNHKFDNPERVSFTHSHTPGGTITNPSPLPPHISLKWDEKFGGIREN